LTAASKWQLIYMGDAYFDPILRSGIRANSLAWLLEYKKEAGDTVECDYLWFVPADDCPMDMEVPTLDALVAVGQFFAFSEIGDFDYSGHETSTNRLSRSLALHGRTKLKPAIENRLYFYLESCDAVNRISEVHGAATNLQMIVSLSYLPQYISPLE